MYKFEMKLTLDLGAVKLYIHCFENSNSTISILFVVGPVVIPFPDSMEEIIPQFHWMYELLLRSYRF